MHTQEGFIEVTGGKVWYQIHGNHINKTPVIILHGGPGSSHWSLQGLKALADDRPTDTALWNIDRFVEELHQIKEGLQLKEFHILGHSWGTTLAAAYYLANPEGVKSIIFSSPCLSAPIWANDQERNREKLPVDVQKTLKTCEENGTTDSEEYKQATKVFGKYFVCRLDGMTDFFQQGAPYKNREVYNIMWGPSEFHVTGNLKNFDCTSQLKMITVPTLFTCGKYDEATPESTKYFSELTPNSKFHIFENSAHMPYIEETEEYILTMRNFLI